MKALLVILLLVFVLAVESGYPAGQYLINASASAVCGVMSMASGGDCGYTHKPKKIAVAASRTSKSSLKTAGGAAVKPTSLSAPFVRFGQDSKPETVVRHQPGEGVLTGTRTVKSKRRGISKTAGSAASTGEIVSETGEALPWQDEEFENNEFADSNDAERTKTLTGDFGGFPLSGPN